MRKSRLRIYHGFIIVCAFCGQIAVYWDRYVTLPVSRALEQAERDGWLGTPHGALCRLCCSDVDQVLIDSERDDYG
jgi:hypothetical protein